MSSIAKSILSNLGSQSIQQESFNFSTTFEDDNDISQSSVMEQFATDFDSVDYSSILSEDDQDMIRASLAINVATQMTLEANYSKLYSSL